jgi:hypothetical protein
MILTSFFAGAIMICSWAIALFFWRFSRKTGDRLFIWLSVAFFLLGIEKVSMISLNAESHPRVYLIRLCAFLLILLAIWDKNRNGRKLR